MNEAKPLIFGRFGDSDDLISSFLDSQPEFTQAKYLQCYLEGLDTKSYLIEQNYFDRDYLEEFSSFYSLSARGYPNVCKRIHFFDSDEINRDLFEIACSGDIHACKKLQNSYVGFSVIRPITKAPFGRTVFRWYDDRTPETPRVTEPSRDYACHIAGIKLSVKGLAWQQQDSGVAACATVSLWSMLHSSAFDARHSIPTTSKITKAAHEKASLGKRVFPSHFLTIEQVLEAIKEQGLAPAIVKGDLGDSYFSKDKFAATCASFLRSGYPLLIAGHHTEREAAIGHAICAVGFREAAPISEQQKLVSLQDAETEFLYIHDDNIGPNIRFRINEQESIDVNQQPVKKCHIHVEDPEYLDSKKTLQEPNTGFAPTMLIAAVHEDLRISSDQFFQTGFLISHKLSATLKVIYDNNGHNFTGLVFSTRFIKISDYMQCELSSILEEQPNILGNVRLKLQEEVAPMSLHLGILRIALPNSSVLLDVLYDSTDSDLNRPIFCHIVYDKVMRDILNMIDQQEVINLLGTAVDAF